MRSSSGVTSSETMSLSVSRMIWLTWNSMSSADGWVETPSAAELWNRLQTECLDAIDGCDVLTIPHNSNLSTNGLMFASGALQTNDDRDLPITEEDARKRARFEPIIEIMQHKGDSECALSNEDEFCAFEKLPYDTFGSKFSFFDSSRFLTTVK